MGAGADGLLVERKSTSFCSATGRLIATIARHSALRPLPRASHSLPASALTSALKSLLEALSCALITTDSHSPQRAAASKGCTSALWQKGEHPSLRTPTTSSITSGTNLGTRRSHASSMEPKVGHTVLLTVFSMAFSTTLLSTTLV